MYVLTVIIKIICSGIPSVYVVLPVVLCVYSSKGYTIQTSKIANLRNMSSYVTTSEFLGSLLLT